MNDLFHFFTDSATNNLSLVGQLFGSLRFKPHSMSGIGMTKFNLASAGNFNPFNG